MDTGLVDLSLFAVSPTPNNHQFTVPEIPAYRRGPNDTLAHPGHHDEPLDYPRYYAEIPLPGYQRAVHRPVPRVSINKPLPPLPQRTLCGRKIAQRRDDANAPRCILSRIKRARTAPQATLYTPTIQQRRNLTSAPHLTLSVSQPHRDRDRGGPALPMVWMPDEQMWLIAQDEGFETRHSSSFESRSTHNYIPPRSARSESELSPVRSQFRTLMERQPERREAIFQEAIHGVTMFDYDDLDDPFPQPEFRVEHDWQSETSSWHTAESGVSALSEDPANYLRPFEWEGVAMEIQRIQRPSSAL
ncbi:MAG: hypothetical protein Q9187_006927 [Circinaria calcarea]